MKKFLPAVAGLLAIACTQPLRAQTAAPCDVKGILTAPGTGPASTAVNPEYPVRTNTFNWYYGQQNNGRWWNMNIQPIPTATAIWLPWEQSDNTNLTHILGKTDLPTDGWELIKRNLGYNDAGAPVPNVVNPYVVLYNKRSGMLRVFVATGKREQDYKFAEIKLVFNTNGPSKKAGTLNRLEGIGTALEDTTPGKDGSEFSAVTRFINEDTRWFMADFPMEYDPCTCQFDSKLTIEVSLISEATITLEGTTTGTLMTVNKAAGTSSTNSDFDDLIGTFKKVRGAVKTGQGTYKNINKFSTSVLKKLTVQGTKSSTSDADAKKGALGQLAAALATDNFLKDGLKAAPYIGAAVSMLDAFFGGGKAGAAQQPVSLQPMSIEMSTKMSGTITADNLYSTISFNNPGTRAITIPEEYPYYNEALGVLSVLRRPVVELKKTFYTDANGKRRRTHQYRVPNNIQYLINPAAGLDVQDFEVAILQEGKNFPAGRYPASWQYEGLTASNAHVMRTKYVDAGCLSNNIFRLDTSNEPVQPALASEFVIPADAPTYLKFVLNLRPRNATGATQNVLLVLKYPVTIEEVDTFTPLTAKSCGVLAQADASTVQTFCNGSVYAAAMSLSRRVPVAAAPGSPAAPIIADVRVYPNPATEGATLRFSGLAAGRVSAYLTDMVGHRVSAVMLNETIVAGEQHKFFTTSTLAAGLYLCVVETSAGSRTTARLNVVH